MNTSDSNNFPSLHQSGRPLFEDTVDILHFLEADRKVAHAQRLHRDRTIGQGACESGLDDSLKTVLCWWRHAGKSVANADGEGQKVVRVRGLVNLVVVLFGLISGLGVVVAVFQYDGSHPINVVTLIAVFVILQTLLISMSLLMLLPGGNITGRVLETINPGAMLSGVLRRRLPGYAKSGGFFSGIEMGTGSFTRAHQSLLRWQLFSWSQLLGCAFNTGALLGAVLLIVFTDLAFGWSSTLMLESAEFQKFVYAVAIPWSGSWPDALPSQLLIEQSRYYRLDAGPAANFVAQNLTAWWPFVIACILTYGLLPRVALWCISRFYLRRALVIFLTDNPQVIALLDRMRTPEVALASPVHGSAEALMDEIPHKKPDVLTGEVPLIIWSDSVDIAQWVKQYGVEVGDTYRAGGLCSIAEDQSAINSIGNTHQDTVIIAVKSWEPPLNDLLDFVSLLRQECGPKTQIILLLSAPDLSAVETQQLRIWRHALNRLSDSRVFVEADLAGSTNNG